MVPHLFSLHLLSSTPNCAHIFLLSLHCSSTPITYSGHFSHPSFFDTVFQYFHIKCSSCSHFHFSFISNPCSVHFNHTPIPRCFHFKTLKNVQLFPPSWFDVSGVDWNAWAVPGNRLSLTYWVWLTAVPLSERLSLSWFSYNISNTQTEAATGPATVNVLYNSHIRITVNVSGLQCGNVVVGRLLLTLIAIMDPHLIINCQKLLTL